MGAPTSRRSRVRSLLAAGAGALVLVVPIVLTVGPASVLSAWGAYEGFGASTAGGSGQPVVHVTNLNDSGTGSLRTALASGNRQVVFDVGGEILLASEITIKSAFITVDAWHAPAPGITLRNRGLIIRGPAASGGAGHDVILTGLRIRDAGQDGIWVTDAAYNVVIDHVSVQNSFDGNIDITRVGTRDVTVQWSILAEPAGEEKNMLLAFGQSRITLHHNLFIDAEQRSPQVTFDDSDARTHDSGTTLDMRNNLIWDWRGGYGTRIRYGGNANVVDNFYSSDGGDEDDALIICKGLLNDSECYSDTTNIARAYVAGNVSADGVNLNNRGTETDPFAAAAVTTQAPAVAACLIRDDAGARPLDPIDQGYVGTVVLSGCSSTPVNQTITFGTLANRTMLQTPVMVSATASSGLAVTFSVTTPAVCSSGGTNGSSISLLTPGTCTVKADQAGNAGYNPAAPVSRSFTVSQLAQTISFAGPSSKTMLQSPVTVAGTATSGLPVTFSATTPAVCASGGTNGGTITLVAAGTCSITATQAGNAVYHAATPVVRSFTVSKASQTIAFGVIAARTMAQGPFAVSGAASSGLVVTFSSMTPAICTSTGTNGATITLLGPGTCTIRASQPGSTVYAAAPVVNRSFAVTKVKQTITFATLTNRTLAQSPVTVSAAASSGLAVTFTTSTPAVCTAGGTNGATITLVGPGTCSVRADQAGDVVYATAPAVVRTFKVT